MSQYYENQNLEYCKAAIKQSCNDTTASFVKIGYYLKQVRDRELFTEDGYQDIWKFAETEFGISKSSASRFMSINDRFSVEGNSPNLLPEYVTFSSSKLSEMLTLSDKQIEEVKPETTVKQVREMKPKKVKSKEHKVEVPKEEATVESKPIDWIYKYCNMSLTKQARELIHDDTELFKMYFDNRLVRTSFTSHDYYGLGLTSKSDDKMIHFSTDGHEVLAMLWEDLKLQIIQRVKDGSIPDDVNNYVDGDEGVALIKQLKKESVATSQQDIYTLGLSARTSNTLSSGGIGTVEELRNKTVEDLIKIRGMSKKQMDEIKEKLGITTSQREEKKFYNQVPLIEENSVEWIKQHEAIDDSVVVEAEYKEVIELIYNGEEIFNDYLKSNGTSIGKLIDEVLYGIDTSDRNQYRSTQIRNGLIGKLLRYTESFSKFLGKSNAKLNMYDNSIQPDLPSLKNNNQRKEWIEQYRTWSIWIDQSLTGEKFYKYDFDNGTSFVVRVSQHHPWDKGKYSEEVTYGQEEYFLLGAHDDYYKGLDKTFRESSTNKSAMVDYLKEMQKEDK